MSVGRKVGELSDWPATRADSGLISCEDAPRIVDSTMKFFRDKANVPQPSEGCWAEVFMDAFFGEQERK